MIAGASQEAAGSTFVLQPHGPWLRLVARDLDGDEGGYVIDPQPRRLHEFAAMCEFHQRSPESRFTRARLCTLPTPGGRITLSEMRLIRSEQGVRSVCELADEAAYLAALRCELGIELARMPRNKSHTISRMLACQAVDIHTRARRVWRRWTEPAR